MTSRRDQPSQIPNNQYNVNQNPFTTPPQFYNNAQPQFYVPTDYYQHYPYEGQFTYPQYSTLYPNYPATTSSDNFLTSNPIDLSTTQTISSAEIAAEKKRETIVKKEHERRSRINLYFDNIKDLLPDDMRSDGKLTKEKVLIECRDYIKKLQSQIAYSQHKIPTDPFTSDVLTQEEIDHGFLVFYSIEYQRSINVTTKNELNTRLKQYAKLIDLSEKSSQIEHKLAAYNFAQYSHVMLFFIPSKTIPLLEKTYELLKQVKHNPKSDPAWLSFGGIDLKVMLLGNFASAYALIGDMNSCDKYWNKALERCAKINQEMSEQYTYILIRSFCYIQGKKMSVEIAEKVENLLKSNPHFNILGFLTLMSAKVENSENPSEFLHLVPKMEMCAKQYAINCGSYAEVFIYGIFTTTLTLMDPEGSLKEIDAMIERFITTGIVNLWNLSDFYRIKADCLLRIHKHQPPSSVSKEIESLLDSAAQIAENQGFIVSQMKALTMLAKTTKDKTKLAACKSRIQLISALLTPKCTELPQFLIEAQNVST